MIRWRLSDKTLCHWPARPKGIIEIIGGSYLSFKPEISYKILLDELAKKNLAIHLWSYVPSFDHQTQANQAWKSLRKARKSLEGRVGKLPSPFRMGHSLGCKLHLISPDGGRNSQGLIALSFNNFPAKKSVPLLGKINSKFNYQKEFSPNTKETLKLILNQYRQPRNLLITFNNDKLDQSKILLKYLKTREIDKSENITLKGNHLTPVSIGIKSSLFIKDNAKNSISEDLKELIKSISTWTSQ